MKKEVASIFASVLILLISFQNCQKPPYADEINGANIDAYSNSVDLGREVIQKVGFAFAATQTLIKAGNSYQVNYNKVLTIDVNSGAIIESSDIAPTKSDYCLSAALKNELVSILKSSQVCTRQPVLPAGTMCTQVLKLPYAQVVTAKAQYELGSATDGCGSNSVDLCDDQANILKGYIEALKKQYQQLSCPL